MNEFKFDPEELERLKEIVRLGLAEVENVGELERFVETAAAEFGLPLGLVSIVLDGAQHFVAGTGLDDWLALTRGTPIEWSFCKHAVATKSPFVVPDATKHPLVRDNPLVIKEGIRSYAGAPLLTKSGHALGALCVIGTVPREFTAEEIARLEALAAEVVAQLESRVEG